jgi:hypothetical protein
VAVGDFNGDGLPDDLAVADLYLRSGVSVLLGNGDGSFQAAQDYRVGAAPSSVAVGDFNGDGIQDLVVTDQSFDLVRVLVGQGDGSLHTTNVSYVTGREPVSVAVGDFNGDGLPDLAVVNRLSGTVSVLLNDGVRTGGGRPAGAHPRPRAAAAAPDLVAEAVARLDASAAATVPPPGATGRAVQDSRPLPGADAAPGETRAAGAAVRATQPPALGPVWARAAGAAGAARLPPDHLPDEPEGGWLGDPFADGPGRAGAHQ